MIDAYQVAAFSTYLLAQSDYHKNLDVTRYLHMEIFPAVNAAQAKIYLDDKNRPKAMVTWAFLSDEIETEIHQTGRALFPNEWTSGDNLFFNDWITPFGDLRDVLKDMTQNRFPDRAATSLRRNPDGSVRRVNRWTGPEYRRARAQA